MTVHNMRQITALKRANARWHNAPANHLQIVPSMPPRRTLGDRIADLGNRLDNSRTVWALIGTATAILYITYIATHWPHA